MKLSTNGSLVPNRAWWVDRLNNDSRSSEIAVTAGYGSGKTFGGWQWLLGQMGRFPHVKTFCFTEPTYGLIDKVAIPKFREVTETLPHFKEDIHYTIRSGSSPKISLRGTKQEVLLLSMDSPESLVGFECGKGVSDEAALNKEESDIKLDQRMRLKGVDINQLVKISTPEGLNFFADRYDSDELPDWTVIDEYDHFKSELIITDSREVVKFLRRFRLTTYMNEANLPNDYIAGIYSRWGHNQNYIDSYIYGFFRPFSQGLAYHDYKSVLHKIDPIEASHLIPIALTWDFNIQPQWVAIQEQIEYEPFTRKRLTYDAILDNANCKGETLLEAIAEFCIKFPVEKYADTPIHIYGDSTGHHKSHKNQISGDTDFKYIKRNLQKAGYHNIVILALNTANPLERKTVEAVNTRFVQGQLRVTSICDMVLKSLSRTSWKDKERAKLDKPAGDTWTHPMDAVKYYIWAKYNMNKVFA